MHGENGTPATPEWTPQPGNTCASCAATGNYCHVIDSIDHGRCCPTCSHCQPLIMPLLGLEDQA